MTDDPFLGPEGAPVVMRIFLREWMGMNLYSPRAELEEEATFSSTAERTTRRYGR